MRFFRRKKPNALLSIKIDADLMKIRTNDKHARRTHTCQNTTTNLDNESTSAESVGCFGRLNSRNHPVKWVRHRCSRTHAEPQVNLEALSQSETDSEDSVSTPALVTEFQAFLDQEAQEVRDLGIEIHNWMQSSASSSDGGRSSNEMTESRHSQDSQISYLRPPPGFWRHLMSGRSWLSGRTAFEMAEIREGRATFSSFLYDIPEELRRGKLVVRNPGNDDFSESESSAPFSEWAIQSIEAIAIRGDTRLQPEIRENPIPAPRSQQAEFCSSHDSPKATITSMLPKTDPMQEHRSNTISTGPVQGATTTAPPPSTGHPLTASGSSTHEVPINNSVHDRDTNQNDLELHIEKDQQNVRPLKKISSECRIIREELASSKAIRSTCQGTSQEQLSAAPSSHSAKTVLNSSRASFSTATAVNDSQQNSNKSEADHSTRFSQTRRAGDAILKATGRHPKISNNHVGEHKENELRRPDKHEPQSPRVLPPSASWQGKFSGVVRRISNHRRRPTPPPEDQHNGRRSGSSPGLMWSIYEPL